jgi:5-methylcytosine-specific restriction endonuclease McrA
MKTCKKCGQVKPLTEYHRQAKNPDGLQYWCKDCKRQENRDRAGYFAQRRIDKAKQISAQSKERYATDPDFQERKKRLARDQKFKPGYRAREHARYYRRAADPNFQKKKSIQHRERRHNDAEYHRKTLHWTRLRRARIKTQGVPFTHAEWIKLCARYNHQCLCCGETKPLTPDHVVPVSLGGSSDIGNIQPLCIDCNKRKNARTIDYR